jgi:hypothetical protein
VAVEAVEEVDHLQEDHQQEEHPAEEAPLEDLPLHLQLQQLHQHRMGKAYMEAHHRCSMAHETKATSSYRNSPCTT